MSMFGNLTAGYIREAIEKEINETEAKMEEGKLDNEYASSYISGLERAREIAASYED